MNFKQCTAAFLIGAFALTLAACGKPAPTQSTAPSTPPAVSESTAQSTASAPTLPQDTQDGALALQKITPPYTAIHGAQTLPECLPADLQQLYNAAYYLAFHFIVASGFDIDPEAPTLTMDNDMDYYVDKGFASYSAFRAALDAVFTEEYKNGLLNEYQCYVNDNDTLYALDGARGANIFYKSVDFAVASMSESEIVLTMTGHYAKDMADDGTLSEEETTMDYTLRILKTQAGWRFSEFALPL